MVYGHTNTRYTSRHQKDELTLNHLRGQIWLRDGTFVQKMPIYMTLVKRDVYIWGMQHLVKRCLYISYLFHTFVEIDVHVWKIHRWQRLIQQTYSLLNSTSGIGCVRQSLNPIYIYIYIYIHTHTHTHTHTFMNKCTNICTYVYVHRCIYIFQHVNMTQNTLTLTHTSVVRHSEFIYLRIYIHMYIRIYLCIYIYVSETPKHTDSQAHLRG